jgi:hypothetical protein
MSGLAVRSGSRAGPIEWAPGGTFGAHPGMAGAFTILRFPEQELPDVVYLGYRIRVRCHELAGADAHTEGTT